MWVEVCVIAESVVLDDESDELKWQFQSSGIYFSHWLHSVINFREVVPMFIPAVWKIVVPLRIHIFFVAVVKYQIANQR
jgi:hypothetical protein